MLGGQHDLFHPRNAILIIIAQCQLGFGIRSQNGIRIALAQASPALSKSHGYNAAPPASMPQSHGRHSQTSAPDLQPLHPCRTGCQHPRPGQYQQIAHAGNCEFKMGMVEFFLLIADFANAARTRPSIWSIIFDRFSSDWHAPLRPARCGWSLPVSHSQPALLVHAPKTNPKRYRKCGRKSCPVTFRDRFRSKQIAHSKHLLQSARVKLPISAFFDLIGQAAMPPPTTRKSATESRPVWHAHKDRQRRRNRQIKGRRLAPSRVWPSSRPYPSNPALMPVLATRSNTSPSSIARNLACARC